VINKWVRVQIVTLYDSEVIADLGTYGALGPASSIFLSANPFRPDTDPVLQIRDQDQRGLNWPGTNSTGQELPNGQYVARLLNEDGSHVDKTFALERQATTLVLSLGPETNPVAVMPAVLRYNLAREAKLKNIITNIHGDVVARWEAGGTSGRVVWNLKTNSGTAIAPGIYLWTVQFETVEGNLQEERTVKLAVVR
jgi:hypothetical protein